MKVIKAYLPDDQYIKEVNTKKRIILHHTVSSGTAESVRSWFMSQNGKIATAYVIDKKGDILQLFDSSHSAYHIGKGSNKKDNCESIGIEIVNEGILTQHSIGSKIQYKWCFGDYNGQVYRHSKIWRGSFFFAEYTEEQIISAAMLCNELCREYNIPKNINTSFEYSNKYFEWEGILSHHNLRADKSDVSPAFNFTLFENALK